MSSNGYTLLIVESPTIARRLQKIVPQHIFVISTKGYLWMPSYKAEKSSLRKIAIPEKLEIRNLIRKESKKAVKIIVATDSDPSGDFIAWSIADDLRMENLYRSNLQALSKTAASNLVKNATFTDHSRLRKRLENRYLISRVWKHHFPQIDMRTAAVVSIFGTSGLFSNFKSRKGKYYSSLKPVNCEYDTLIEASAIRKQIHFKVTEPLSTFKILELSAKYDGNTLKEAQHKLYKLFEMAHPFSDEGLITYPRTSARSFFENSWETIRQQWIQQHSLNDFIPSSLQKITPSTNAHDSIRPVDLNAGPAFITKHIPSDLGNLYTLIYRHTLQAISMPGLASSVYHSKIFGAIFTSNCILMDESIQLRPCLTLAGFGRKLADLGVMRPSGFAAYVEKSQNEGLIILAPYSEVKPGRNLSAYKNQAGQFGYILPQLKAVADDPDLQAETISGILTS